MVDNLNSDKLNCNVELKGISNTNGLEKIALNVCKSMYDKKTINKLDDTRLIFKCCDAYINEIASNRDNNINSIMTNGVLNTLFEIILNKRNTKVILSVL